MIEIDNGKSKYKLDSSGGAVLDEVDLVLNRNKSFINFKGKRRSISKGGSLLTERINKGATLLTERC